MGKRTVSNKLVTKLMISFLLIIFLAGLSYVGTTIYFSNKYFLETEQRLNANLASHLIEEKFQDQQPFLENGEVNKALFGDLMHDMMAVNRGIEVYLLDGKGKVLYSVVLDHSSDQAPKKFVDLAPIRTFITAPGSRFVLGDDPLHADRRKIFSAAPFEVGGRDGFIYIVLAGEEYADVGDSLLSSYFLRLGVGASMLTLLFAALLGILVIWYLTRNLREIIHATNRFKEGDLQYRIAQAEQQDLALLATTFNSMAGTILDNIEKIKSVENLRRELIANISHDLRTPLSVMQGYVETLQMKSAQLSEQEKEKYLEIISDSTERLSKLIAQLFEYSKLEANQIEPVKEPFMISELVSDLHMHYQILAEKKGITLGLEVEEQLPLVFADIGLVERAIQNLMDNALKFTPKGGVVTMQLRSQQSEVEVLIKDTGLGIPEQDQALIFERYRQSKTGKDQTGAGLGLAIVKKIIEIHDSTISVLSRPNAGTTFRFSLPVYQLG
ncbi:MAG: HAMP domain-containing sensor histidine kinase [Bacteroidota bacterium]